MLTIEAMIFPKSGEDGGLDPIDRLAAPQVFPAGIYTYVEKFVPASMRFFDSINERYAHSILAEWGERIEAYRQAVAEQRIQPGEQLERGSERLFVLESSPEEGRDLFTLEASSWQGGDKAKLTVTEVARFDGQHHYDPNYAPTLVSKVKTDSGMTFYEVKFGLRLGGRPFIDRLTKETRFSGRSPFGYKTEIDCPR